MLMVLRPHQVKEDMESFDRVLGGGGSSGDMTSDGKESELTQL